LLPPSTTCIRNGSTPYDSLTIAVKFSDGIATAEDIRIEGPAAKITLTGTASVPTREYDMKGVASLNTTSGFQLPFMVQGPWDDPLIFPDPESLIRQSPAASPFLDLLKRRITGEKHPAPTDSPTADNAKDNAKSN